jgi:hypothetical protein
MSRICNVSYASKMERQTYHASPTADFEYCIGCFVLLGVAEGSMEGSLGILASADSAGLRVHTGSRRLMTLKLRRHALICVTVLL